VTGIAQETDIAFVDGSDGLSAALLRIGPNRNVLFGQQIPGAHPDLQLRRVAAGGWLNREARDNVAYVISLEDTSGRIREIGHFRSSEFDILSISPLFFAGCTLDSQGARWACSVRLFGYPVWYDIDRKRPHSEEAQARALLELLDSQTIR
jgi:hypothetical protein